MRLVSIPRSGRVSACACLLALLLSARPAAPSSPYIWDQDGDGLDDRIETVHLFGYELSFENADTLGAQRFEVSRLAGGLIYGLYVIFDHPITPSDMTALALLGLPSLHRVVAVPAVRSLGTFAQAQAVAGLPGVERVEAVPVLQPLLRDNVASIGAVDPSERVFPTWDGTGGASGQGVVVAIVDGGVNDEPQANQDGHESVSGRFLGGAQFLAADSTLDTGRNQSVNPADHGGPGSGGHGTHMAGAILGTGGPSGFARGVAPGARFVDVKVLNDAGIGTGLPEALDWCIWNASRDWGAPGFEGIDVINLSLSSPDSSDGNDLASRLAAEAVRRGIVVVASMGNQGTSSHVPSPAAGDGVIAVGAYDAQRTPEDGDDVLASFTNQGPRASDGDADLLDELKPDLVAPGVAVLSADGQSSSDGHQYRRLSGTSVSAALVSGAVACLRSANPSLPPAEIARLLRETARRDLPVPPAPPASDPRWHPARGFGALDLYAAKLELESPQLSQVARLGLVAANTQIAARLQTQREVATSWFVFERAPDVGGVPGTFAPSDSVASTGDASLVDGDNRQSYDRLWSVPGNERGVPFWYRVAFTAGGVRHTGPARRFVSPAGPSVATLEIEIVHSAYDTDVGGDVEVGGTLASPALSFALPGSGAAVASEWVDGPSTLGNVKWTFHVPVPSGTASAWLPPTEATPWRLHVSEGGFVNRSGRVTAFRLIQHGGGGDETYEGGPVPRLLTEGQSVDVQVPTQVLGAAWTEGPPAVRVGPNPVRANAEVRFALEGCEGAAWIDVLDVGGRRVAHVPARRSTTGCAAAWRVRDDRGRPLPAGVYLARAGQGRPARFVVLAP